MGKARLLEIVKCDLCEEQLECMEFWEYGLPNGEIPDTCPLPVKEGE